MVMLYDYHHGKDFIDDPVKSRMYPIDRSNVDKYIQIFGRQQWQQIDFRKFSKVLNPNIKQYDFGLDAVLAQFPEVKPQVDESF
ncbi:hypothetical protein [Dongshaea marina]|uniref:hypothetical protein n=1 Tax=Dongshaea marina TaxID=2047966 RepID=UPI000D3E084D|nr:hypothetical protein [Dongshaea marina]